MSDGMRRELVYLSSHATNRYFIPNWGTGMSQDFSVPVVAEYDYETNFAPQPKTMSQLPMSLWNVALEVHSGRIFIGSITTYIFIFVMHFFAIWCLWSDYRI